MIERNANLEPTNVVDSSLSERRVSVANRSHLMVGCIEAFDTSFSLRCFWLGLFTFCMFSISASCFFEVGSYDREWTSVKVLGLVAFHWKDGRASHPLYARMAYAIDGRSAMLISGTVTCALFFAAQLYRSLVRRRKVSIVTVHPTLVWLRLDPV